VVQVAVALVVAHQATLAVLVQLAKDMRVVPEQMLLVTMEVVAVVEQVQLVEQVPDHLVVMVVQV
jgi:hypothetical protein